jgi:hypothetical protein
LRERKSGIVKVQIEFSPFFTLYQDIIAGVGQIDSNLIIILKAPTVTSQKLYLQQASLFDIPSILILALNLLACHEIL